MNFEGLNPELQEKAKAAKTPEVILALAKEEGYEFSDNQHELSDDQHELSDNRLATVAGGRTCPDCSGYMPCPDHHCGQEGS